MADNNFIIDLIAKLQKTKSKQQIKSDAKNLGDIPVPLVGHLNKAKTKAQIKKDLANINGTVNLNTKVNSKGVVQAVQQASTQAQKKANAQPIQMNFTIKKNKLISDIQLLAKENSRLWKNSDTTSKYTNLLDNAKLATSSKELNALRLQLGAFRSELKVTGNAGLTMGDALHRGLKKATELFGSYGIIMGLAQLFKNAWQGAVTLDSSMTSLSKVNDEISRSDFPDYIDKCISKTKQLATEIKGYIDAVTEFSKSGYSLSDSEALAEKSTVLSNVGEMSQTDSSKAIISGVQAYDTIDGFDNVVDKAQALNDKLNEIGNTASITTGELANGVQSVGSVFADANTSVDEFIALLAAGNRQYQNADSLALGLRTSALRIRGCTAELEEMGEETDGVYDSVSKTADVIAGLTNVNGKGGVRIFEDDGETFRSIYDIFLDISKVYDKMSDTDQSALLDLIAGKHRASGISATLNNMTEAQQILQNSLNATGSSTEEYEKYLDSAEASITRFGTTMTEVYNSVLNGNTVKGIADTGNAVLEFANSIGLVESTLKGFVAIGVVKGITQLGTAFKATMVSAENFGEALTTVNSMNTLTKGTQAYNAAMDTLKSTVNGLSEVQLKQVLANEALSQSQRVQLLMQTGLTKSQATAKLTQMGLVQTTNAQTVANGAATASTFSLSAAVKGFAVSAKVAFLSNPISISIMAISTALGAVASKTSEYNQKMEEARQKNIEAGTAAAEQAKNLQDVYAEYDKLSSIQDRTTEQEDEFKTAVENITTALGIKAEVLSGLTAGTDEYTEALKNLTKAELENQYTTAVQGRKSAEEQLSKDIYSAWNGSKITIQMNEQMTGVENHMKALNTIREQLSEYENTGMVGGMTVQEWKPIDFDKDTDNMENVIEYYNSLIEARKTLILEAQSTGDNTLLDSDIYKDIDSVINSLTDSVEDYQDAKYNELKLEYTWQNGMPTTIDAYNKMEESILKSSDAGETFQETLKGLLSSDFSNLTSNIKDEIDEVDELLGQKESSKFFTDMFSSLPIAKLEEYISLIKSGKIDENTISSYSELAYMMEQTGLNAEDASKKLKEFAEGFTLPTEMISNLTDTKSLIDELSKVKGNFDTSSLEKIVKLYPTMQSAISDYIVGLKTEGEVIDELTNHYNTDIQNYGNYMIAKNAENLNFANSVGLNSAEVVNQFSKDYGIDIGNHTTYAQKKIAIEQQTLQTISDMWAKFYDVQSQSLKPAGQALEDAVLSGAAANDPASIELYNKLHSQSKKYEDAVKALNNITYEGVGAAFNDIASAGNNGKSGSGKKENSDVDWIERRIKLIKDGQFKIETALNDAYTSYTGLTKEEIARANELFNSELSPNSSAVDELVALANKAGMSISELQKKLSDGANFDSKQSLLAQTIEGDKVLLGEYQNAAAQYSAQYEKLVAEVSGYRDKIENGGIDIDLVDSETNTKIKNAIDALDKLMESETNVSDTRAKLRDDSEEYYSNEIAQAENVNKITESRINLLQTQVDYLEAAGTIINGSSYERIIDLYESKKRQIEKQLVAARKKLAEMNPDEDTDKYSEMETEILGFEESLYDASSAQEELNQKIRELPIENAQKMVALYDQMRKSLEDYASVEEASGRNLDITYYQEMINLGQEYIQQLQKQQDAIQDAMDEYDTDNSHYLDLQSQLADVSSAIQSIVKDMYEWNKAILELPINNLNNALKVLTGMKSAITDNIALLEANGGTATKGMYEDLITGSQAESKYYEQLKEFYKQSLQYAEKGSEQYYELVGNIQDCDSNIKQCEQDQAEWNKAILNIPLDVVNKYNDKIQSILDTIGDVMSDYDAAISAVTGAIQNQIDAIEDEREAKNDAYNEAKDELQDELDLLNKQNTALNLQTALEQKQYDAENARSQKTVKTYDKYGNVIYNPDDDAVRSTESALKDAEYDITVDNIQTAIDDLTDANEAYNETIDDRVEALNKESEKWSEIKKHIEDAANEAKASEIFGDADWKDKILSGNDTELFKKFVDAYTQMSNIQTDYTDQIDANEYLAEQISRYMDAYESGDMSFEDAYTAIQDATKYISSSVSSLDKLSGVLDFYNSDSLTGLLADLQDGIKNANDKLQADYDSDLDTYLESFDKYLSTLDEEFAKALDQTINNNSMIGTYKSTFEIVSDNISSIKDIVSSIRENMDDYESDRDDEDKHSSPGNSSEYVNSGPGTVGIFAKSARTGLETGAVGGNDDKYNKMLEYMGGKLLKPEDFEDGSPYVLHPHELIINEEQQKRILSNYTMAYQFTPPDISYGNMANRSETKQTEVKFEKGSIVLQGVQNTEEILNGINRAFAVKIGQVASRDEYHY